MNEEKVWNEYRSYVMKKYKFDYETADEVVADAFIYYVYHGKTDDFYKWGIHKCNQLAQNKIRDSKEMTLPLYFEDDDGEVSEAYYVSPTYDDYSLLELLSEMEEVLTPQEIEICKYLGAGYSQVEIATIFNVSKQAIGKKVKNIREKLTTG